MHKTVYVFSDGLVGSEMCFFFQAKDGIRDFCLSRGLGDVYKRQVWGIKNSFQSIAISRNTSLAIVVPGIAEVLFATALGLLAAIPAVVVYNKFNSDAKRYSARIENFCMLSLIYI